MFKMEKTVNSLIKLISGTALSQVIIILGMPLLTRLYNPQDFGLLAIVNACLMIFGVVGSLRYDQIMYNYAEEREWCRCFNNGLFFALLFFLLLQIIFCIFYLLEMVNYQLVAVPFLVLAFSICQLYSSWLSLNNSYSLLSYSLVTRAVTMIVAQYYLYRYIGNLALIAGLCIGQFSQLILLHYTVSAKVSKKFITLKVDYYDIKSSLLSSGQSLSNSLSSQLPSLFIPYYYGLSSLGLYSLATRLTYLPINFFSNAVRPLILGEFNRNSGSSNQTLLLRGSLVLFMTGVLGIILINVFAESFFIWYAGPEWAGAGEIASALSFWIMCAFANVISTSYLTVKSFFKSLFVYDFGLLIARCIVVAVAFYYSFEFIDFVYAYSYVGAVFNIFIIIYTIVLGKKSEKSSNCYNT